MIIATFNWQSDSETKKHIDCYLVVSTNNGGKYTFKTKDNPRKSGWTAPGLGEEVGVYGDDDKLIGVVGEHNYPKRAFCISPDGDCSGNDEERLPTRREAVEAIVTKHLREQIKEQQVNTTIKDVSAEVKPAPTAEAVKLTHDTTYGPKGWMDKMQWKESKEILPSVYVIRQVSSRDRAWRVTTSPEYERVYTNTIAAVDMRDGWRAKTVAPLDYYYDKDGDANWTPEEWLDFIVAKLDITPKQAEQPVVTEVPVTAPTPEKKTVKTLNVVKSEDLVWKKLNKLSVYYPTTKDGKEYNPFNIIWYPKDKATPHYYGMNGSFTRPTLDGTKAVIRDRISRTNEQPADKYEYKLLPLGVVDGTKNTVLVLAKFNPDGDVAYPNVRIEINSGGQSHFVSTNNPTANVMMTPNFVKKQDNLSLSVAFNTAIDMIENGDKYLSQTVAI